MRPVSPYHEPMPHSSGSGLNAPGGCLSKPTTRATSAEPAESIAWAVVRAEPPVAQPFLTLMKGTPVSPSTDTDVSAFPAASEPPAAGRARWRTPWASRPSRVGPACGGDFGEKHGIVQVHSAPVRASRGAPTSTDVQRGHDAWRGNVTVPQRRQADPISSGWVAVP